ncbi:MAG TPA: hypothetical protein VFR93_10890 [Candidatus Limnocylindrales bacterium]|nr:hypothetical protein [Candidatus Limnocylindrales bacterium]
MTREIRGVINRKRMSVVLRRIPGYSAGIAASATLVRCGLITRVIRLRDREAIARPFRGFQ